MEFFKVFQKTIEFHTLEYLRNKILHFNSFLHCLFYLQSKVNLYAMKFHGFGNQM
jgi:hypothetical protein